MAPAEMEILKKVATGRDGQRSARYIRGRSFSFHSVHQLCRRLIKKGMLEVFYMEKGGPQGQWCNVYRITDTGLEVMKSASTELERRSRHGSADTGDSRQRVAVLTSLGSSR